MIRALHNEAKRKFRNQNQKEETKQQKLDQDGGAEDSKNNDSLKTLLPNKGPLYKKASSLLSQFKKLYTSNPLKLDLNSQTESVEAYLEKCHLPYAWHSPYHGKFKLYVKEFLFAEGNTREDACSKLINSLEDSDPLYFDSDSEDEGDYHTSLESKLLFFLQAKGPDYKELLASLSKFKTLYTTNSYKIKLKMPDSVEYYFGKCGMTFDWYSPRDGVFKLYVEESLIAEGASKEDACNSLVKMLKEANLDSYYIDDSSSEDEDEEIDEDFDVEATKDNVCAKLVKLLQKKNNV